MTAIRHLAASRDGSILAAAEFESTVHLWDLNTFSRLRRFETTLDWGGSRLAVSPEGSLIAVGAYQRHGIAAYRTSDGSELWRRTDLKKVQRLCFSHNGRDLFCCFDRHACERLDSLSGKSGANLRGVRNLWASGFGETYLLERSRDYLVTKDGSNLMIIPKMSFGCLSVGFARSRVCVSEAGGPVRLFDLRSTKMIWRHVPAKGTHFLAMAYQASSDRFVGVLSPYETGGRSTLCHFDNDTGVPRRWWKFRLLMNASLCETGRSW